MEHCGLAIHRNDLIGCWLPYSALSLPHFGVRYLQSLLRMSYDVFQCIPAVTARGTGECCSLLHLLPCSLTMTMQIRLAIVNCISPENWGAKSTRSPQPQRPNTQVHRPTSLILTLVIRKTPISWWKIQIEYILNARASYTSRRCQKHMVIWIETVDDFRHDQVGVWVYSVRHNDVLFSPRKGLLPRSTGVHSEMCSFFSSLAYCRFDFGASTGYTVCSICPNISRA